MESYGNIHIPHTTSLMPNTKINKFLYVANHMLGVFEVARTAYSILCCI